MEKFLSTQGMVKDNRKWACLMKIIKGLAKSMETLAHVVTSK